MDPKLDTAKEALKRDWEQTKSDLTGGKKGIDLGQEAGDTVKQATGSKPLPPLHERTLHPEKK